MSEDPDVPRASAALLRMGLKGRPAYGLAAILHERLYTACEL